MDTPYPKIIDIIKNKMELNLPIIVFLFFLFIFSQIKEINKTKITIISVNDKIFTPIPIDAIFGMGIKIQSKIRPMIIPIKKK